MAVSTVRLEEIVDVRGKNEGKNAKKLVSS